MLYRGIRFPIDVILVCIRWYVVYPLSYQSSQVKECAPAQHGFWVMNLCDFGLDLRGFDWFSR